MQIHSKLRYLRIMNLRSWLVCVMIAVPLFLVAQSDADEKDRKLVQFSGVVVTGDSLAPVPFANVIIKNSYRGTMSDVYGYFSFVAQLGDTIIFSALGFERGSYAIPMTLTDSKYSMIHVMYEDTILLRTLDVYPWPSKDQFKEAFLELRLPDDEQIRAMNNLSDAEMLQQMENLTTDAYSSYKFQLALDQTRLYEQGGTPQINLFNPIAWAQFVRAWQNGDFKNKKDE